jgi:hypothetical protein
MDFLRALSVHSSTAYATSTNIRASYPPPLHGLLENGEGPYAANQPRAHVLMRHGWRAPQGWRIVMLLMLQFRTQPRVVLCIGAAVSIVPTESKLRLPVPPSPHTRTHTLCDAAVLSLVAVVSGFFSSAS